MDYTPDGDSSNDKFLIFSENIPDAGIYEIILTASLDNNFYDPQTTNSDNVWQFELVDPCLDTVINQVSTGLTAADIVDFPDLQTTVKV